MKSYLVSQTICYNGAITHLLHTQRFTALLALNDGMDLVAAQAIGDGGLSVPEDVSLIGHSTLWSELPGSAGITTLRIPARPIGAQAARMLLTQIAGETLDPPQSLFLYTLVHRASTSAAQQAIYADHSDRTFAWYSES